MSDRLWLVATTFACSWWFLLWDFIGLRCQTFWVKCRRLCTDVIIFTCIIPICLWSKVMGIRWIEATIFLMWYFHLWPRPNGDRISPRITRFVTFFWPSHLTLKLWIWRRIFAWIACKDGSCYLLLVFLKKEMEKRVAISIMFSICLSFEMDGWRTNFSVRFASLRIVW